MCVPVKTCLSVQFLKFFLDDANLKGWIKQEVLTAAMTKCMSLSVCVLYCIQEVFAGVQFAL